MNEVCEDVYDGPMRFNEYEGGVTTQFTHDDQQTEDTSQPGTFQFLIQIRQSSTQLCSMLPLSWPKEVVCKILTSITCVKGLARVSHL